ncbi:MAG: hypothetical protein ACQGVC_26170 [Myxococcota bacterium]
MRSIPAVLLGLLLAGAAGADVLETRDGRVLTGTYLGGTQQSVRFETGGSVQVLTLDQVLALTFDHTLAASDPAAPPAAPPPAPVPLAPTAETVPPAAAPAAPAATTAPAATATLARVSAGTRLQVRMVEGVDARQAAVGDGFTATLESGLGIDGRAIVPAGSKVYGRVAELRDTGPAAQRMKLELTGLMVQGQLLPLVTGSQTPAAAPAPAAAAEGEAAPAAVRPGAQAGAPMEFRLLQPFELRLQ